MAPRSTKKAKVALKKPVVRRSSQAASKKPIISVGTLVALVVFAAIVLAIVLINRQKETAAAEATPAQVQEFKPLFTEASALTGIEIKPKEGAVVKLARDAKNAWAFELPVKAEADQGMVESAASQVYALQIVQSVSANADPSVFGFDAPSYVITFKFGDAKPRVLEVGDKTPSENGYYVRLDKGDIVVADVNGIEALALLVTAPPYLYTPTPEPAATETALPPTPTLAAPTGETPTPAAELTPTAATPAPETSVTPTP